MAKQKRLFTPTRTLVLAWLAGAATLPSGPPVRAAEQELTDSSTSHDWPCFLGPHGDGKSLGTGLLTDWPPEGPPIAWTYQLGESYGIGSVYQGKYYQFDHRGGMAQLVCLDSHTGRQIWQFAYASHYVDLYGYNRGPRCSPLIDGDRVYLFGVEGMLHCISTKSRSVVWRVDTKKEFRVVQNFFGVASNPVIFDRLLIVMIGGSPPEDQRLPPGRLDLVRGDGSGIVAFDKFTGQVVYRLSDELASCASLKLAWHGGRPWCFALMRGGLLAFHPGTGKQDFHFPWRARILESVNASTPVVVQDQVFVSETYGPGSALLRFRPGSFDVVWQDDPNRRQKAMQAHWATPIYLDGYLYGCSGRHASDAELRCIEWQSGRVMWSRPGMTRSSLLYADGHIICLAEDGTLYLLVPDPHECRIVAQVQPRDGHGQQLLDYPAWAAPILADGQLYARGGDRVVCFDLRRKRGK